MLDGGATFDLTALDPESGGNGVVGAVFRASPAGTTRVWTPSELGEAVAFAPDLDGDGYDEAVLSSPTSFKSNGDRGVAIVAWGGTAPTELRVDVTHPQQMTYLNGARPILAAAGVEPEQVIGPRGLAVGYSGTASGGGGTIVSGDLLRPLDEFSLSGLTRTFAAPESIGDVRSLASGDVNGDGRPDLVVGTSTGRIFLAPGESPPPASVDWNATVVEITPGGAAPRFARALVAIADFNRDGIDDVAVTGPMNGTVPGRHQVAYVLAGRASWEGFDWNQETAAPDRLLSIWADVPAYESVAVAPDLDGDGANELLFGAPAAVRAGVGPTGRVDVLYRWQSNILPGMLDVDDPFDLAPTYLKIEGASIGGGFGSDVAGLGDFDGDSWPDIAASSAGAGRVDVFLRPGEFGVGSLHVEQVDFATLTYVHPQPGARFGSLSHVAGDFDGDGLQDLLIGAPGRPNGGEAYLIYGRDDLGTLDQVGGPGPDALNGGVGSDGLLGGAGDDVLDGGATPPGGEDAFDWLLGGAGNDRFVLRAPFSTIVSGGRGFDVVELTGRGWRFDPTSLAAWPGSLDVESFDLDGDGPNSFWIGAPNLIRGWFPSSRRLIVRRGEDDGVAFDWSWTKSSVATIGGDSFDVWTSRNFETWVEQVPDRDFGDAWGVQGDSGDAYPTLLFRDGARHVLGGPRLGALVDAEEDAASFADAQGDDYPFSGNGQVDDEDGVRLPERLEIDSATGGEFEIVVTLSGASTARLDAWIDFDGDGDWDDPHDRIFDGRLLSAGDNSLTVAVPAGVTYRDTFARFRVSSAGGLAPTGLASDGEVEDYELAFVPPTARFFDDLGTTADDAGARWDHAPAPSFTLPAGIGDFNGDGFDDVAVAVPGADGPAGFKAGAVYVLWGDASGAPSGTLDAVSSPAALRLFGPGELASLGYEIAGAGDWNGDGLSDLAVATAFGDASVGSVYVLFGSRQAWPSTFDLASLHASRGGNGTRGVVFRHDPTQGLAATSLAFVGDVNADGRDDLAFGRDTLEGPAEIYVLFGRERPVAEYDLRTMAASLGGNAEIGLTIADAADAPYRGLGQVVAGIGDVNGDGIDDFAVGLPIGAGQIAPSGEVVVIFGNSYVAGSPVIGVGMPDRALVSAYWSGAKLRGMNAIPYLGASVTGLGDVNGDGLDDFAAGSYAGDAVVVFGAAYPYWVFHELQDVTFFRADQGGDGSRGVVIHEGNIGDLGNENLAGPGDVNGDGYDDVLVGAFDADPSGQIGAGAATVLFGHGGAWPAEIGPETLVAPAAGEGVRIVGERAGHRAGRFVAPAGDVDGDGAADWVAGTDAGYVGAVESYLVAGDSRAAATARGDSLPNSLAGTSQADVLHGLQGADHLDGVAGADALFGGAGDDELFADLQFLRADGGSGVDTLTLRTSEPSLDLRDVADGRIRNVEVLRIATTSTSMSIQADLNSVARLAPPSHRLVISADGRPWTSLADEGNWTLRGAALVAPTDVYFFFRHGSYELWLPQYFSFATNPLLPWDVNADGFVSPVDALLIINELNVRTITASNGAISPPWVHPTAPIVFWDVNDDGFCSPVDALRVINLLNNQAGPEGNGEAPPTVADRDVLRTSTPAGDAPAAAEAPGARASGLEAVPAPTPPALSASGSSANGSSANVAKSSAESMTTGRRRRETRRAPESLDAAHVDAWFSTGF